MKILLINPPIDSVIFASIPKEFYDIRGVHPPLGLLYIASFLLEKNSDYRVEIYDMEAENKSAKDVEEKIKSFCPDIVGVQMLSMLALSVLNVLKIVKKVNSKTVTVVGGVHPTLYPVETAALADIDYVVVGEGELTFNELVENIQKKQNNSLKEIKGIAYKKNGVVIVNKKREEIKDIDSIPLIDRDLLSLDKYTSFFSNSKKSTSIITSRGCPHSCIFCFNTSKNFRAHSPEYVISDIKNCLRLRIKDIFVVDDNFSLNIKRAKMICQYIINEKLNFHWYINTRINSVDEELLHLLKKAGCRQINYGIETGSQKIADILQKNINLDEAKDVIKNTKKAGIKVLCYFMLGLPEEKKEDLDLTMKFIKETNPNFVRFSVTTIEPMTTLYSLARERKIVQGDIWRDFAKNPKENFSVPVWDEYYSKEELNELLVIMSKKYYFSFQYIIGHLLEFKNWFNFRKNLKILFLLLKKK